MVLPVTNIFRNKPALAHRPILNSIPNISNTVNQSRIGGFNLLYHRLWKWFRESPELVAIINIIATDVIGDRPEFVKEDGEELGRNKALEARRFWREHRVKETLKAILFDMLITGDGYGWVPYISQNKREEMVKEIFNRYRKDGRLQLKEKALLFKAIDEDLKKPKGFDYVASSTMNIETDSFDVQRYIQRSNGLESHFTPKEIIHYRLNTMDGKIEGFSPVEALSKELMLLWFVKGNMLAYMENGGSPGKLFTVKTAGPGQPAFDRFVEQLQSFKTVKGRHGSLVGSGEITVDDLDKEGKDMEYQNLALYMTSAMAFAFGIPVNRIPFLIGKSATGGDSGGLADAGYWNMISELQDKLEDLTNIQLFDNLGWNFKFTRKYKQDDIRDAQAFQMNVSSIEQMQTILRGQKMKLSERKLKMLMNLRQDDVEEMTDDEMLTPEMRTGLMNQNVLSNNSVNKEPDNRKKAATKRNVANASASKGMSV